MSNPKMPDLNALMKVLFPPAKQRDSAGSKFSPPRVVMTSRRQRSFSRRCSLSFALCLAPASAGMTC